MDPFFQNFKINQTAATPAEQVAQDYNAFTDPMDYKTDTQWTEQLEYEIRNFHNKTKM